MERNWLIRTTQNQILGPVAKDKLIEFINKGALGLNDEISSGNGYWIVLRERELVERYVFGDIPQGYNPISESKSVLSRRDNPDKTSSLNLSPANLKTQIVKLVNEDTVLPKQDDLEYPDMPANDITMIQAAPKIKEATRDDITVIKTNLPLKTNAVSEAEISSDLKLPSSDDLEFPDLESIKSMEFDFKSEEINLNLEQNNNSQEVKLERAKEKIEEVANHDLNFPKNEDLEFPDPEEFLFAVNLPDEKKEEPILDLKIEEPKVEKKVIETRNTKSESVVIPKKDRLVKTYQDKDKEEKISLYERKTKKDSQEIEEKKNLKLAARTIPEELNKRNDNYLFFILVIISIILLGIFFYYREILNKPLPI